MDEITILQADVLKTLASPRRLAIIHCLAGGPRGVGQLAVEIQASQTNVSQHLALLRFNLPGRTSEDVATELAAREIAVWHGDYYAVEIMKQLGLEGTGAVRAGFVHYHTTDEVERLLTALDELC